MALNMGKSPEAVYQSIVEVNISQNRIYLANNRLNRVMGLKIKKKRQQPHHGGLQQLMA